MRSSRALCHHLSNGVFVGLMMCEQGVYTPHSQRRVRSMCHNGRYLPIASNPAKRRVSREAVWPAEAGVSGRLRLPNASRREQSDDNADE